MRRATVGERDSGAIMRRAAVVRICTGAVKTDRRVMAKRTDGERMRRQDGYEL